MKSANSLPPSPLGVKPSGQSRASPQGFASIDCLPLPTRSLSSVPQRRAPVFGLCSSPAHRQQQCSSLSNFHHLDPRVQDNVTKRSRGRETGPSGRLPGQRCVGDARRPGRGWVAGRGQRHRRALPRPPRAARFFVPAWGWARRPSAGARALARDQSSGSPVHRRRRAATAQPAASLPSPGGSRPARGLR